MDRLARQLEGRREIRDVDEPRGLGRRQGEQFRQHVERMDARQVADVALDLRVDVIAIPGTAPRRGSPRQGGGISAGHDALGEARAETVGDPGLESAAKERVDEARPPVLDLALRKRMQPQNTHPSGERIGQVGDEQDVGRAGEHEASWGSAMVDGDLERREEFRYPLHLLEDGLRRKTVHKADRISLCCSPHGFIIERHVPVPAGLADGAGQRCLAALPPAVDQDGRGIAEAGREVPGKGCGGSGHG